MSQTEGTVFDVREFGAKGDGVNTDTQAIQSAIDTCAQNSGGMVVFPTGKYLTGSIFLKSNVTLYLSAQAVLLGSTNNDDYHSRESAYWPEDFLGILIYADGQRNIGLAGPGAIDGQGAAFPYGMENFCAEELSEMEQTQSFPRPILVCFQSCQNISVTDITMQNSASMCLQCEESENITINGLRIDNRVNQNNDGMDLLACKNVRISNCDITCGDDAIAIFTSARNFVITNCIISTRWAAFRMGPFSTGTFKDIAISNCVIYDTYGCAVKMQMVEGGVMENICFDNLVMDNVTGPISLRLAGFLGWRLERKQSLPIGTLRNIRFNNIQAKVADNAYPLEHEGPRNEGELRSCINITGLPCYNVEGITFSNIHITYPGGGTTKEAARRDIPELKDRYPEYHMFGILPAYGLYVRHAHGITLENVRFELAEQDFRPAIVCDDVEDLELSGFRAEGNPKAESLICLQNTKQAFIHDSRVLNDIETFLRVEGTQSGGITLAANELKRAKSAVVTADGAKDKAVATSNQCK